MRRRLAAVAVALTLVAGVGVAAARPGRAPAPGPVVRQLQVGGHPVTLVVAPGRPGPNVVQAFSPHGLPVTGGGVLDLPAGRSSIPLAVDSQSADVPVELSGPSSGVEVDEACASWQLGAALAGRPAHGCVAEPDRDAVGAALVRHLAEAGVTSVVVSGPGAAALAEAARLGLRARPDDGAHAAEDALVVLGSVEEARRLVASAAPGRGIVLAPWLLEPSVLGEAKTQVTVASWANPGTPAGERYLAALGDAAPGVPPTGAGLAGFTGERLGHSLSLWTPTAGAFLPRHLSTGHDHSGHHGSAAWVPGGRLALVRTALPLDAPDGRA